MWNKNIYQTYECDFDELHESFKKCCNLWKSTYPDWDYNFKNSEERRKDVISILCLSPDETKIYDGYPGITQADIWRYAITSANGGMYADLDSIPVLNVEPILCELDANIELVALPDGDQIGGHPGSNNCNFILKAESEIAMSLLFDIKKYFNINAKRVKNNLKIERLRTAELFAETTVFYKSKVAQILDTKYVLHGKGFKPPQEYMTKYEKTALHNMFK